MASNINLDGFQEDRYFARSWALITQEKGWWKPVLLLGLASLIPIVGPLAVLGYCLEWSRRVAWGSTEAPARRANVGTSLSSGWRGFVVLAGWAIAQSIVGAIVAKVPGLGSLLSFAWNIFSIFLGMLFMAAAVRATIYRDFKAGYRAKTIWEMGSRDATGLCRIWLIKLVAGLAMGVVALIVMLPTLFGALGFIVDVADGVSGLYYMSDAQELSFALYVLAGLLSIAGPAILTVLVLMSFLTAAVSLITYGAIGLWLRQFDVPAWGKDEDPLPEKTRGLPSAATSPQQPEPWQEAPAAAAPAAPVAPAPTAELEAPEQAAEVVPAPVADDEAAPNDEPATEDVAAGEGEDGDAGAAESDVEPPIPGDAAADGEEEYVVTETIAAAPEPSEEPGDKPEEAPED